MPQPILDQGLNVRQSGIVDRNQESPWRQVLTAAEGLRKIGLDDVDLSRIVQYSALYEARRCIAVIEMWTGRFGSTVLLVMLSVVLAASYKAEENSKAIFVAVPVKRYGRENGYWVGAEIVEQSECDKCFVIMPFGEKALKDGTGRMYDFDKVYRVIIKRAIRQAGMEPIRADEQTGAHIIHSDMFKELRDRPVVLADLSSENPNVYYELGIRHVLAPRGTVLICREGSELPFDIKLSRVIFYRYDGRDLDWENAELVVPQLQAALEEARRGEPDSPVHALLETVFPQRQPDRLTGLDTTHPNEEEDSLAHLAPYQILVAKHFACEKAMADDLVREHGSTTFGARVLGYLCLNAQPLPEYASQTAGRLYTVEQYGLACEIYERLDAESRLKFDDLIRYGSAISEKTHNLAAAEKGMALVRRAFDMVSARAHDTATTSVEVSQVFKGYLSLAGMLLWKWLLTRVDEDLDKVIQMLHESEAYVPVVMAGDTDYAIGRVAQLHLRLLFLLRVRDSAPERPDSEKLRDATLRLQPAHKHSPRELSYLRWYKAITMADLGDEVGVSRMVMEAVRADDRLAGDPEYVDIGRRQYTLLRRFIESHLNVLHNHALIGQVSRALDLCQSGRETCWAAGDRI